MRSIKANCCIVILLLTFANSLAQNTFTAEYYLTKKNKRLDIALENSKDSNYVFLGVTGRIDSLSGLFKRHYIIYRTNYSGIPLSYKELKIETTYNNGFAYGFLNNFQDSLVFFGNSAGLDSNGVNSYIPYIVKLGKTGSNGNAKELRLSNSDFFIKALNTKENGFIILGSKNEETFPDTIHSNSFILKLDSNLAVEWCKVYYDSAAFFRSNDIIELPDSGYFICTEVKRSGTSYLQLTRTDKWGNQIWNKVSSDSTKGYQGGKMLLTADTCIIIASASGIVGSGIPYLSLVKVDLAGNLKWSRKESIFNFYAESIFSTYNNGFMLKLNDAQILHDSLGIPVFGYFQNPGVSFNTYGSIKTSDNGYLNCGITQLNSMYISKKDSLGIANCGNISVNISSSSSFVEALILVNSNLLDTNASINTNNIGIMEYDSIPSYNFLCSSSNVEIETKLNQVQIFPIPVESILTLKSSEFINEVSLYDILGKNILNMYSVGNESYLQFNNLVQGVYILKVTFQHSVSTFKILKQ